MSINTRSYKLTPQLLTMAVMAAVLLLCSSLAQAAITPALYQVSKGEQSAYLFGSFHAGKQQYYPLPSAVQQAFNESDLVIAEVNLAELDPMAAASKVQTAGIYTDGSRLRDHIRPSTYKNLVATATRYGLPKESLDMFRPWLVALTLTQLHYASIGMSAEFGVDQHLVKQAADSGKPIMGLETFDQQLDMLLEMDSDADETLKQTLEELNNSNDYARMLTTAWEQGDGKGLADVFDQISDGSATSSLFVQKLLIERNRNWVPALEAVMRDRTPFVVVGSLHIEGPENLRQLLEARGYKIKRIRY